MLEITVNDKPTQVPDPCTIADLLGLLNITSPAVAVELNLEIQPHSEFADRQLKQGDSLEIVTLVGGG